MAGRRRARPPDKPITSTEDLIGWLDYLCLSSDSLGLHSATVAQSGPLISMRLVDRATDSPNHWRRASALRAELARIVRENFDRYQHSGVQMGPAPALEALLGLVPHLASTPAASRRAAAADAFGQRKDTFQRRSEQALLRDLAGAWWAEETDQQSSDDP